MLLSVWFLSPEIQAATVTVQVGPGTQMLYSPNPVSIAVGDTIHWVWSSTGLIRHSVTSGVAPTPDGLFDSGEFPTPHSFDFTFNTAGTFPYFCTVHGIMMTGSVEVATATPTPTAGDTNADTDSSGNSISDTDHADPDTSHHAYGNAHADSPTPTPEQHQHRRRRPP